MESKTPSCYRGMPTPAVRSTVHLRTGESLPPGADAETETELENTTESDHDPHAEDGGEG
jgi:hypothetical protein